MRHEVWEDVKGFEGLYQVSNTGKLKSLARHSIPYSSNIRSGINRIVSETILDGIPYKNNNMMMTMVCPNISKKYKFTRKLLSHIVAETFIPNPNKLKYVNHIDGNLMNNHVDNLEWSTRSAMQAYKGNKRPVLCVTNGVEYDSVKECAEAIGVGRVTLFYHLKSGKPINGKTYAYLNSR